MSEDKYFPDVDRSDVWIILVTVLSAIEKEICDWIHFEKITRIIRWPKVPVVSTTVWGKRVAKSVKFSTSIPVVRNVPSVLSNKYILSRILLKLYYVSVCDETNFQNSSWFEETMFPMLMFVYQNPWRSSIEEKLK